MNSCSLINIKLIEFLFKLINLTATSLQRMRTKVKLYSHRSMNALDFTKWQHQCMGMWMLNMFCSPFYAIVGDWWVIIACDDRGINIKCVQGCFLVHLLKFSRDFIFVPQTITITIAFCIAAKRSTQPKGLEAENDPVSPEILIIQPPDCLSIFFF